MEIGQFASAVRQILVIEKQRPLRDVAQALGMEYATFHSRVNGRAPFRPEEITKLIVEVPDPRLVDALLADTRFIGVERLEQPGWGDGAEAVGAALQSATEMLAALAHIHAAAANGRIDTAARRHLEAHVHEAERSLARLRLALPHLAIAASREAA